MWSYAVYCVKKEDPMVIVCLVAQGSGYPTELLARCDAEKFKPVDDDVYSYHVFVREE